MVVQLDQLGRRGVVVQRREVARARRRSALCSARSVSTSGSASVTRARAGLLVDQVAPDPLQEPLRADHVPGRPGPGDLHRPGRHLVQPEGVGAVALAHLVGGHHVAQRLAHLPVLAADRLAVPRETGAVRVLDDLLGRHVGAARVGVGEGLDVALVEQPAERLLGADVAQVVQHLVPEPGVQQVQHRVLHAADVQVDAARVAGPGRVLAQPVVARSSGRRTARRSAGPGSAGSTSRSRPTAASCWSRGGSAAGPTPRSSSTSTHSVARDSGGSGSVSASSGSKVFGE